MKVVIDTNVFVSSFFGGNPREVINLWRDGNLWICLSNAILDEYIRVFQRLKLNNKTAFPRILRLFRENYFVHFCANPKEIKIVEADPDDDKFIGCAISLEADFIISGDKHLLNIKEYLGIQIVSPKDFLENVQKWHI